MALSESSRYELGLQAEAGDTSAQYRLGVLFLLGSAIEQDVDAACRWLLAAAAGHRRDAQALVERLAPFYRGATGPANNAKLPRILRSGHAAVVRGVRGVFDRSEEAATHLTRVFKKCLTAQGARTDANAGPAERMAESLSPIHTD